LCQQLLLCFHQNYMLRKLLQLRLRILFSLYLFFELIIVRKDKGQIQIDKFFALYFIFS
jgi:hypothetical protein